MKIIILHGDSTIKSYERLMKFIEIAKKRNWEIITNEFPNTPSLFGTDRLKVYRDYKLLNLRDIKNFNRFEGTLVIYHNGVLPQTFLKQMPKDFTMEKFELPKLLFVFLESFYPSKWSFICAWDRDIGIVKESFKIRKDMIVNPFIFKR